MPKHDASYRPPPDSYAWARCGCNHFRIQHGENPSYPDAKPGCWWVCGCREDHPDDVAVP